MLFRSSRALAPAIRARQELTKRLVALGPAPRWEGPRSLASLLTSTVHHRLCKETSVGLARLLADEASARYPSIHLDGRSRDALPAQDTLLTDVARVNSGRWEFLGTPLTCQAPEIDWTVHPGTGARYPDIHWHRLPLIGVFAGDVKCVWELNRHRELVRLAQGYLLLRDEELANRAVVSLERWMDQNAPGRGINWASSLEVAYRAIAWCWIWHLTRKAAAWQSGVMPRFLWFLWHHARHIERYDSIHHSPNTHLTGEALGLLYVGLLFPEFRHATRWAATGVALLEAELQHQVLDDGMHFERATGYHRYTVEIYTHCAILARAFELPVASRIETALRSMVRVSQALARPDGSWPIIGDEDSGSVLRLTVGRPDDQRPMLAVNAGLLGDPQWALGVDQCARAAGWWLLDEPSWTRLAAMPDGELPAATFALASAGYYGARDRERSGAWFCLVDAGPHGGDSTGHAHTDVGHVEIARGDVSIIADPGSSSYTADLRIRDYERSENAHACLVVEDAPLARPRGPFSWRSIAATPLVECGSTDDLWWCELTYARPASGSSQHGVIHHRRHVVLVHELGVVVCDEMEGAIEVDAALHWPIPHDPSALQSHDGSIDGPGFGIGWAGDVSGGTFRAALDSSWYSPAYGERLPATLLRLSLSRARRAVVATVFTAFPNEVSIDQSSVVVLTIATKDARARLSLHRGRGPSLEWLSDVRDRRPR